MTLHANKLKLVQVEKVRQLLHQFITISPEKAAVFFKTGLGQYAEHDEFLGITVPNLRKIAKSFQDLELKMLQLLLHSRINEERLLALIILTNQYQKGSSSEKAIIFQFYLNNMQYINNWNLVDASAHLIIGAHLHQKEKLLLLKLAQSNIVWERRISIVSTWYFIRHHELEWTFKLSTCLLQDNS